MKSLLLRLSLAILTPLSAGFSQDFVNGQAADVVIGKPDFVSSTPSTPSASNIGGTRGVFLHAPTGKLFVCDQQNNRILRFSSAAAATSGSAAEAIFGQPNATSGTTNNGGRSATSLDFPNDCFADSAGRLWVADRGNNRVLRFDGATADTVTIDTFTADQVLGQANFTTGGSGTTAATMSSPLDVWLDTNGNLYVVDQSNNRVTRFDNAAALANGAVFTRVFGQPNPTTSTPGTSNITMRQPTSATVDSDDHLWVADLNNARVLRFDNASSVATDGPAASGVLGQTDFTTGTTGTSRTKFNDPVGVAIGANGRLWVGEFINNRVTWFDDAAAKPDGAPADGVLGQTDFTTNDPHTTASGFFHPWTVYETQSGKLWVTDEGNGRVLRFSRQPSSLSTPTVKIKGKAKVTTSRASLTIKGTSTNAAKIEVKVGKANFKPAKGTTSWKFKAKLKPGRNKLLIRAISPTGTPSASAKVTVTRQ